MEEFKNSVSEDLFLNSAKNSTFLRFLVPSSWVCRTHIVALKSPVPLKTFNSSINLGNVDLKRPSAPLDLKFNCTRCSFPRGSFKFFNTKFSTQFPVIPRRVISHSHSGNCSTVFWISIFVPLTLNSNHLMLFIIVCLKIERKKENFDI